MSQIKKTKARRTIIKQVFFPFGETIARSMAEELEVKEGLLLTKDAYIEQKTKEILRTIDTELLKKEILMKKAGEILYEKLNLLPEKGAIEQEMHRAIESLIALLKPTKKHPSLKKEDTFQAILGLSDNTILWIYSVGYQLFQENKYEEALSIFQMLTMLNPLIADYFVAQGLSERSLNRHTEALYSFALASLINPNHPSSRYNSIELYLELNQVEDAILELEVLEKIIKTNKLLYLNPFLQSIRTRICWIQVSKAPTSF